jgi:hypothetical protein
MLGSIVKMDVFGIVVTSKKMWLWKPLAPENANALETYITKYM